MSSAVPNFFKGLDKVEGDEDDANVVKNAIVVSIMDVVRTYQHDLSPEWFKPAIPGIYGRNMLEPMAKLGPNLTFMSTPPTEVTADNFEEFYRIFDIFDSDSGKLYRKEWMRAGYRTTYDLASGHCPKSMEIMFGKTVLNMSLNYATDVGAMHSSWGTVNPGAFLSDNVESVEIQEFWLAPLFEDIRRFIHGDTWNWYKYKYMNGNLYLYKHEDIRITQWMQMAKEINQKRIKVEWVDSTPWE